MFYSVSTSRRKQVDRSERLHGFLRLGRNIVLSMFLLAMVLMIGGFTYALFSGHPVSKLENPSGANAPPALPKPTPPNPRNPVGVAIEGITTPTTADAPASLTIKTTPGASCGAKIAYPSTFRGQTTLAAQIANDYGVAAWNWQIVAATPIGIWPITVTCAYFGHSAVAVANLQVTN